ncbi:MAG: SprB repeat-containing protein, partial [Flavobacteriales bacterium]
MNRFLLISSISVFFFFCSHPGVQAQCDGTVLNNLTGGNSLHTSAISSTWSKHEWDITFPSQFWGQTLKDVKLWYRLVLTGNVTVNGGFTTGNDGSPVLTFVNASTINSTPPNTSQTDYYIFFDFTGQNLSIPSNGVLWFRFDFVSGYNGREDIGSNTYTSTYQQNDNTRSGYTSFAIYADLGFTTTQTIMNALCYADSSGSATVSASGSNPPYSFLWDSNANNQTDSTATGLAAGTYLVTITDSLGCQDVDTVTVGEPPAITSATASTDILCNSDSSGSATVMAGGGTQGYTYAWSDWNNQADTTATGLAAGTYYVTVTDSNGCTLVDTVLLSEPPALTLNIVANDDVEQSCVGNATAFAGGGTPQYTYQ